MVDKEDREIAKLLIKKEVSWNELNEQKKRLAREVYGTCSLKLKRLSELVSEIRHYKFNKSSIAEELHINRKTLGSNNQEISYLLDLLIDEGKTYWAGQSTSKSSGLSDLKIQNELYQKRDCELVEKDNEIRELKNEIESRKKQYNQTKEKLDSLQKEYDALVKKICINPFTPSENDVRNKN